MGSSAWVVAVVLGLVAVHTVSATNYTVGGTSGWTNNTNINYTAQLAAVQVRVGDTLRFENLDTINHTVLIMPNQSSYDACIYNQTTDGVLLYPGQAAEITFHRTHPQFYVICGIHCASDGQKVSFSVASADGTLAPPPAGSTASPPPPGFTASPPSPAPTPAATPASPPASPPAATPTSTPTSTPAATPTSTPAATPAPSTSSTPSPATSDSAASPPPPAVTSTNPFGIVRNGAAGIPRFGWLTIAVVCALSCYNIL